MKGKLILTTLAAAYMALAARPATAQQPQMAESQQVEITATVVDLSCKLVYGLTGDMHRECAQVCADRGISLGLLSSDGTFYLPVSSGMPGDPSNALLRAHAEHQVTVRGRAIRNAGMNSIIIESVSM